MTENIKIEFLKFTVPTILLIKQQKYYVNSSYLPAYLSSGIIFIIIKKKDPKIKIS